MPNQTPLSTKTQRILASRLIDGIPLDLPDDDGQYWGQHADELHQRIATVLHRHEIVFDDFFHGARLVAKIDYSKSIEELVAEAKVCGWIVHNNIALTRLVGPGLSHGFIGVENKLVIGEVIPPTEHWNGEKVLSVMGDRGRYFNLRALMQFLPHWEKLYTQGFQHIVALGWLFRDNSDRKCAPCLQYDHGERIIDLWPLDCDWQRNINFGSFLG